MDFALAWAIVALVLVIAELVSGTFYLLMLGLAGFGAAGAAWLGYGFAAQCVVGAVLAGAGCYGVHIYRAHSAANRMPPIDPDDEYVAARGLFHRPIERASNIGDIAGR